MKFDPDSLAAARERIQGGNNLNLIDARVRINVHLGTCGLASGADEVLTVFKDLVARARDSHVLLMESGCAGLCRREPMVTVQTKGQSPVKYVDVNPDKARRIFNEHVLGGTPVAEYALGAGSERVL